MYRALVYKELRETGWIALIGLAAHLAFVAENAGYQVLPFSAGTHPSEMPFL